jgi:hypothetical protein
VLLDVMLMHGLGQKKKKKTRLVLFFFSAAAAIHISQDQIITSAPATAAVEVACGEKY